MLKCLKFHEDQHTHPKSSTKSKQNEYKGTHTKTHFSQINKTQGQWENLESSKRKLAQNIQWILNHTVRRFLIRNYRDQKVIDNVVNMLTGKTEPPKSCQPRFLYLAKLSFNSEGRLIHSHKTKVEGVDCPWSRSARNAQGALLGETEAH